MFSDETKQMIARDTARFQEKQIELRDKLGAVLEGYPDSMIYNALHSALLYGFKQSNGEWHPAPKQFSSETVIIAPNGK